MKGKTVIKILATLIIITSCAKDGITIQKEEDTRNTEAPINRDVYIPYRNSNINKVEILPLTKKRSFIYKELTSIEKVTAHAELQTKLYTEYDGSYVRIGYPGGDVGYSTGVCTDVVVRALRAANIDLQELIHNDMNKALDVYNRRYKTEHVDKCIDHRRTQNIQTYLTRLGAKIKVPENLQDCKPGDILFWDIAAGHTGIVVQSKNEKGTYNVVHNIGGGAETDDTLNWWVPTDVYRLTNSMIKKMQDNCIFKYDLNKDFEANVR